MYSEYSHIIGLETNSRLPLSTLTHFGFVLVWRYTELKCSTSTYISRAFVASYTGSLTSINHPKLYRCCAVWRP